MKKKVCNYIITWVEENIYSQSNIEELIHEIGYSRRTVEAWFKNEYHISLGDYILKRRISRAAVLARLTSLSVTEIAHLLNYQSSQGFARSFKKYTGISPLEYRKSPIWEIDRLQAPLFIKGRELPKVEICVFESSFIYNHKMLAHEHVCEPAIADISEVIRKLLLRSQGKIKEISIAAKKSETKSNSRDGLIDVEIFFLDLEKTNKLQEEKQLSGLYAKMRYEGDWKTYSLYNKMIYMAVLSQNKLKLRNEVNVMKFISYTADYMAVDIYIPIL